MLKHLFVLTCLMSFAASAALSVEVGDRAYKWCALQRTDRVWKGAFPVKMIVGGKPGIVFVSGNAAGYGGDGRHDADEALFVPCVGK